MNKKKKDNSELEALQQKCDEYLNGWKRALADYQNLQKDSIAQRSELIKSANAGLILELLPIMDNFKIAFKQIPENEMNSAWVVGFSHIKKQLEDILSAYGVENIQTVGQKFNFLEHEAVANENKPDHEDQMILVENKPGYKLHGKVIQVAKVTVNNKENKIEEEEERTMDKE